MTCDPANAVIPITMTLESSIDDRLRRLGARPEALTPVAAAGSCRPDFATADAAMEAADLLQGIVRNVPGVFAVVASGSTMHESLIGDGDTVLLQEAARVRDGEQAAVRIAGSAELVLRRVYSEGDRVRLQPNDRRLPGELVPAGELTIVGRVIAIVRRDPNTLGRHSAGATVPGYFGPARVPAPSEHDQESEAAWERRRAG